MSQKRIIFITNREGDKSSLEMFSTVEQASRLLELPLEVVYAEESPAEAEALGVTTLPTTILMGPEIEITRIMGSYWLTKTLDKLDF